MIRTAALIVLASISTVAGEQIRVIDGDTVMIGRERIRLERIDAPEVTHPRCRAEAEAGTRAKRRLGELLAAGDVRVTRGGHDRYRRTLATLTTADGDVGEALLDEGLALPWHAGRAAHAARAAHGCG